MLKWLSDLFAPVAIQFDLAAAGVAIVALLFSIVSFYRQRRLSMETLRLQAENDLLGWLNATIETLVSVEFLLRSWSKNPQIMQGAQFGSSRDQHLETISVAIDKGRMYFPKFPLDKIGDEAPSADAPRDVLDDLVEIYDVVLKVDPNKPALIDAARMSLLLKKRSFMSHAREKIDFYRRNQFLKT
jgi:hypothetical protein